MNAQGKRSGETAREYAYRMIREQVISLELKPGEAFNDMEFAAKIFLNEMLGKLEERERQLIRMRYFQDHTQTEIAEELGISQVQVSRMEKKILKKLREQI